MKKKSVADVADQLQELALQGGDADLQLQHLLQLQRLFAFSSAGLGQSETESFREQLQKIPSGMCWEGGSLSAGSSGRLLALPLGKGISQLGA